MAKRSWRRLPNPLGCVRVPWNPSEKEDGWIEETREHARRTHRRNHERRTRVPKPSFARALSCSTSATRRKPSIHTRVFAHPRTRVWNRPWRNVDCTSMQDAQDVRFVASNPWSSHRGTKHPLQTHPRTRRTSRTTHAFDPFAGSVSRIDVHDVCSNDAFLVQATSRSSTCRAGLVRPNPSLGTLAHLSARIHALFVSRARTSFDRSSVVRSFACVLGSIDRSIDPQV